MVGMENARRMLLAGFTTVRDLGGFDLADFAVKHAVDRGAIVGPRMLVALSMISITSAALSSAKTNPYTTTRMLFSLARSGYAPLWLARVGSTGEPTRAVAVASLGMLAATLLAIYARNAPSSRSTGPPWRECSSSGS